MTIIVTFLFFSILVSSCVLASPTIDYNPWLTPATVTDNAPILRWDNKYVNEKTVYQISFKNKVFASIKKTNYTSKI